MKKIKIKQEKQYNGVWGCPLSCTSIDYFPLSDQRKHLIFNASLVAIAETHNTTFQIFNSSDENFFIKIQNTIYKLEYHKLEVVDDILYKFDNEKEHKIFFRKQKIKKLKNELYCSLEE